MVDSIENSTSKIVIADSAYATKETITYFKKEVMFIFSSPKCLDESVWFLNTMNTPLNQVKIIDKDSLLYSAHTTREQKENVVHRIVTNAFRSSTTVEYNVENENKFVEHELKEKKVKELKEISSELGIKQNQTKKN